FAHLQVAIAYVCHKRKIRPRRERRVDVDEINLPGELLQQRSHHQQVVAPDKFVPPAVVAGIILLAFPLCLTCSAALVDGRKHLEGQAHPWYLFAGAILVIFAGPDQFGLGEINLRHEAALSHRERGRVRGTRAWYYGPRPLTL